MKKRKQGKGYKNYKAGRPRSICTVKKRGIGVGKGKDLTKKRGKHFVI